jgi:uncharacterized protein
MRPTRTALIEWLNLEPLPVEGGLFRQTWRGPEDATGAPVGTCIYVMLTADADVFSAMHRLPTDEIWHFYLGDPLRLVLLHPDGTTEHVTLGQDLLNGQRVQFCVPAGCWIGARLIDGGDYALFGCTMAPGFTNASYEGGERDALIAAYPAEVDEITRLTRVGASTHMPEGL